MQPQRVSSHEKSLTRFKGYLAASALSFVVNIGLTSFLHEVISMKPMWAYGISLIVLLCINFLLMRYWQKQFVATALTSFGFRVSEWVFFVGLNEFLRVNYLLAMLIVMGISFLLKFFVYDRLIFNKKQSTI
jgi:putative flippase GtrA